MGVRARLGPRAAGGGRRRVAELRRRYRKHQVLAARPDRCVERRGPAGGVALALHRPRAAGCRSGPALQQYLSRDAAHGGRPAARQHEPGTGRGDRCNHRRNGVDVRRAGGRRRVRGGRGHARRGVLERRAEQRPAGVPGQRRAPRRAGRRFRPACPGIRRGRQGEPARRRAAPGRIPLDRRTARLPRHGHRRHARGRPADAQGGAAGLRARVRRGHRTSQVAVQPGAAGGRVRSRDVGRRFRGVQRRRQCLDCDERRRGDRLRLSTDRHADQRLVRGPAAGRQPVRGEPRLPGVRDRPPGVAFPDGAPRALGLRQPVCADSGRHPT